MVADTIRNEYYYDESAGIRQCLIKVHRDRQQAADPPADRYGMGHAGEEPGRSASRWRSSGAASCTSRPSGRPRPTSSARPASPPCPIRTGDRGLPVDRARARGLARRAQRGRLAHASSRRTSSPRSAPTPLKDALVTLHPQSAIEHLHARFVAADGKGSDGAFAFEATEVGATHRPSPWSRSARPSRSPARPTARRSRSPTPSVGAAAAVGAGRPGEGRRRQRAPARPCGGSRTCSPGGAGRPRKVTAPPRAWRRSAGRRVALLASSPSPARSSSACTPSAASGSPGRDPRRSRWPSGRSRRPRRPWPRVSGPGVDLIADDPRRALELLTSPTRSSTRPRRRATRAARSPPCGQQALAGLDRLYGVVFVRSTTCSRSRPTTRRQADGPRPRLDGAPYVLDAADKTVWRIDLSQEDATPIREGRTSAPRAPASATPKILASAAPTSWSSTRRTASGAGARRTARARARWSRSRSRTRHSWGNDINVHVDVRGQLRRRVLQAVPRRPVRAEHHGPLAGQRWLGLPAEPPAGSPTDRPVDGITDLLIDGDIFVAENGGVAARDPGQRTGRADPSEDDPAPADHDYTLSPARPAGRRPRPRASAPCTRSTAQPPDRGVQQVGNGDYIGAVPARRRRRGLDRTCATSWCCRAPTPTRPSTRVVDLDDGLHSAVARAGGGPPPATPAPGPTGGAAEDAQAPEAEPTARDREAPSAVIPLRGREPDRRTPVVTLRLIAPACAASRVRASPCWRTSGVLGLGGSSTRLGRGAAD